jgi:hypothetical protein
VRRKSQTEIREAKSRKRPGNNQVRTLGPMTIASKLFEIKIN